MKKFLTVMLCVLLVALVAAACSKGPTSVSAYQAEGNFPEVKDKLTWEGINALPQKKDGMTADEMRKVVVDFYLFSKNAVWVAGNDLTYTVRSDLGKNTLTAGTVYGGFPYVSLGSGNVYRLMDYMDAEKGVLDVANAGLQPTLFGNQCSISTWWAWGRVVNSADYCYTKDAISANGLLRVGPYTYDTTWPEFTEEHSTAAILERNGREAMYASYAKTQPGDGMVYHEASGHIIMITGKTYVVRNEDGTIDPAKSYMIYSDQNIDWKLDTNEKGDTFNHTTGINKQMTFEAAFDKKYIPFSFKEFRGEDPIEDTLADYSHQGETITREQLFSSKVTANYSICDTYVEIYDTKGNEIYKVAVRATVPCVYELTYKESGDDVTVWGSWEDVQSGCTVKVYTQLATGERPTLWEGKIA